MGYVLNGSDLNIEYRFQRLFKGSAHLQRLGSNPNLFVIGDSAYFVYVDNDIPVYFLKFLAGKFLLEIFEGSVQLFCGPIFKIEYGVALLEFQIERIVERDAQGIRFARSIEKHRIFGEKCLFKQGFVVKNLVSLASSAFSLHRKLYVP